MANAKKQKNNPGKETVTVDISATAGRPSVKRLAIILAILSFVVYANTLLNGYALDDSGCISKNTIVTKGISAIPELLSTPYHYGFHPAPNDLYRPLSLITFAVENQLSPGNAALGHFINVLLFAGCVVLLFLFLVRLFKEEQTAVAFIASLLFALHPIHTEVVANIKSRDELLCFFFAFLSLLLFLKYTWSGKIHFVALGTLSLFLSLLSKETSISFLAVIPLVFIFYNHAEKGRKLTIVASTLVITIAYLGIRFSVLSAYHADQSAAIPFMNNPLVSVPAPASRTATAILLLGLYVRLLVIPYPLVCDYSYHNIPFAGFANIWVILSATGYIVLLAAGVYRLLKKKNDGFAFAFIYFISTILVFSNIFFLFGAAFAERFAFFASAGFCLACALLLAAWIGKDGVTGAMVLNNRKTWMVVVPLSMVYLLLTITRNAEWKDNITLYTADVQKAPDNARLLWYRGNELTTSVFQQEREIQLKKEAMLAGVKDLQSSLAIYSGITPAHQDLGYAFFIMRQFDSAELHSRIALQQDPNNTAILNTLAGVYFNKKDFNLAVDYCKRALAVDPGNPDLANNIGFAYLQMRQYDSSIVYYSNLVRMFPNNLLGIKNLAEAYRGAGKTDSAIRYEALLKSAGRSNIR